MRASGSQRGLSCTEERQFDAADSWKRTPVVAGRVGGIPLQMPEGTGGYLVDTVEECSQRLVELLQDPGLAATVAERGWNHVRRHFLLPRLLVDELRLIAALLGTAPLLMHRWEREAVPKTHLALSRKSAAGSTMNRRG